MEMSALPPDVLIRIAELVQQEDLLNLRLACKAWRSAVGSAQVALTHWKHLTDAKLALACSSFPRTTSLHISSGGNLSDSSLENLQTLSQSLIQLCISSCYWLTPDGVAQLATLTRLKVLILDCCSLSGLPENISSLRSLEVLKLPNCLRISSLPNSISALTALREFSGNDVPLVSLPEGIQFWGALETLSLHECTLLQGLPAGVSGLSSLKRWAKVKQQSLRKSKTVQFVHGELALALLFLTGIQSSNSSSLHFAMILLILIVLVLLLLLLWFGSLVPVSLLESVCT